jgi:biopolymer transport protein ExbD
MAEIIQNEGVVPQRGKRRAKRLPARIDMTPMVDLACLLLTFFMLTTAFTKPKIMEIIMPKDDNPTQISPTRVLNVILAENNQVFFYSGLADPSKASLPTMIKSDLTEKGLRKVLLERNKKLFNSVTHYNDSVTKQLGEYNREISKAAIDNRVKKMKSNDKSGPIVLIKAAEGVKYGNIVNVLNEMAITNTARYAVVNINDVEKKMLQDALTGKNVELQN